MQTWQLCSTLADNNHLYKQRYATVLPYVYVYISRYMGHMTHPNLQPSTTPDTKPKPRLYNPSLTNLLRRRSTPSRWFPEIRRRRLLAGGSRTVGPERNASRRNTKLRASGRIAGNTCTDCRLFRGLCNALASRVHRCTKPRRTPYTLCTTTTIFRSKVRIIDST